MNAAPGRATPAVSSPSPALPTSLPPNVKALSSVSFLTDVSSEMIYPLLPLFLSTVLGASASAIGAIEGIAEATAAFLKLGSGMVSDRSTRRKPLVLLGYIIATCARPLVALAGSAAQVLAVRVTDRVGKGIRTSPRDALLADSVDPSIRGRAFGFHRAADHAGAVVGPLLAFAVITWFGAELRTVFWLAAIPGVFAVFVLWRFVRDVPRVPREDEKPSPKATGAARTPYARGFRPYLAALFVFTLGNCTDAFLLLRASQLGVATAAVPLLWAMLHLVKSLSSTPAGALSDRVGRKPLLVAGWIWFAVVYCGFSAATETWHAWALFLGYGAFAGLTEGAEKALVADLAPSDRRGAAFGWFHLVIGFGTLPASVLFGLVWERFGSSAAFILGAALALIAGVLLAAFVPPRLARG